MWTHVRWENLVISEIISHGKILMKIQSLDSSVIVCDLFIIMTFVKHEKSWKKSENLGVINFRGVLSRKWKVWGISRKKMICKKIISFNKLLTHTQQYFYRIFQSLNIWEKEKKQNFNEKNVIAEGKMKKWKLYFKCFVKRDDDTKQISVF